MKERPTDMKSGLGFVSLSVAGLLSLVGSGATLRATDSPVEDITAVSAKVSSDYARTRLADGSYPVEFYAFGDGGHYGGPMVDETIDPLTFSDVAHVIAKPLANQNYLPAKDPAKTRLVIMVYWGLTFVPEAISSSSAYNNFSSIQTKIAQTQNLAKAIAAGSSSGKATGFHSANANEGLRDDQMADLSSATTLLTMVNEQRDQVNFATAKLLGYDYDDAIGTELGNYLRGTALSAKREDLISEIEDNRYFVVLMAYDFQLMWKKKQHKLLWETRFSIRQRHHAFDKDLPIMADYASRYFGHDTRGLVRKPVPLGHVDVGPMESLGVVSGK